MYWPSTFKHTIDLTPVIIVSLCACPQPYNRTRETNILYVSNIQYIDTYSTFVESFCCFLADTFFFIPLHESQSRRMKVMLDIGNQRVCVCVTQLFVFSLRADLCQIGNMVTMKGDLTACPLL